MVSSSVWGEFPPGACKKPIGATNGHEFTRIRKGDLDGRKGTARSIARLCGKAWKYAGQVSWPAATLSPRQFIKPSAPRRCLPELRLSSRRRKVLAPSEQFFPHPCCGARF